MKTVSVNQFRDQLKQKDRLMYRFDAKNIYIFAMGGHYE